MFYIYILTVKVEASSTKSGKNNVETTAGITAAICVSLVGIIATIIVGIIYYKRRQGAEVRQEKYVRSSIPMSECN